MMNFFLFYDSANILQMWESSLSAEIYAGIFPENINKQTHQEKSGLNTCFANKRCLDLLETDVKAIQQFAKT